MKVKDCMSKDVISITRATPLTKIINIFKEKNFYSLPVIENNGRLVGFVSFKEILNVFRPYSSDLQQMLKTIPFIELPQEEKWLLSDIPAEIGILAVADDIMSPNLVTIEPEENISRAYSIMKVHETKRLFVTEDDRLIGIITLFDIILALFKEKGVI